ncbi:MAG: PKD domain-containing protein [Verrucomicrobia bacterium]|nr:PKD domain-containing protein [Verrucomicrobiota bacterium]
MLPQNNINNSTYAFDQRTTPRDTTLAVNQALEPGVQLTFSSQLRPDLGGAMLADGNYESRWVSENPEEWVMFRFTDRNGSNRRVNITEYAFTAGGLPWTAYRDPKDWEVYASNNPEPFSLAQGATNPSWTLLSSVNDRAGLGRIIPTLYSLPNNQAYSHYLFRLRNQSGGISGEVELTEIQLFNYFEHDNTIDGNQAPVPALSISAETGEAPFDVHLNASATQDPDGDWMYFTWDFGDGHVVRKAPERRVMQHTYYVPGTYTVTLTVHDALGKSAQITRTITVQTPSANSSPVAQIIASETSVVAGTQVVLDASTSFDPDDDAIEFHWQLGDGNSATGPIVTHRYTKAGLYNPVLIVTDARGRVTSSFASIEVLPPNEGRGVISFNASNNALKINPSRGAGLIPVGFWNNMQQRLSPGWFDSNGRVVDVSFATSGRQSSFTGNHPVLPFDGDAIMAQVGVGKTGWGG